MAKHARLSNSRRSNLRRGALKRLALFPLVPQIESLEARRLLTTLINEFGGTASLTDPEGTTLGPDGNIWFTEADSSSPSIGKITPSGAIEQFSYGLSNGSSPTGITAGPDQALWFTDPGSNQIGRIDTSGNITEYNLPTPGSNPDQIALGSDGALWFTEPGIDAIGRISTSGVITQATIPTAGGDPTGITAGPDGALWFTETDVGQIGRVTTGGVFSEFSAGITTGTDPMGITAGPDGNLWFTEFTGDQIGRITPLGSVTEFSTGITANSGPLSITVGSDSNLWFTETNVGQVGRISTAGLVAEFTTPDASNSELDGIASGSDGNLWFADTTNNLIDQITTAGTTTEFPATTNILTTNSFPTGITVGPDGALWFTEQVSDNIGRISTSGAITEYPIGSNPNAFPEEITTGPVPQGGGEANLWFTEDGTGNFGAIGEMNAAGTVVGQFPTPSSSSYPLGITLGPDGNLWFTENGSGEGNPAIGMITPTGQIQEFRNGLGAGVAPNYIVAGPDGALWFTASITTNGDQTGGLIGRITPPTALDPTPVITEFTIPNETADFDVSSPLGITEGTGNLLWFTDEGNHAIGNISTTGAITEFTQGFDSDDVPQEIALGSDGNFWFTDPSDSGDPIGNITPQGAITLYQTPTPFADTIGITAGPDNNIWFTESGVSQIGQAVLINSVDSSTSTPATVFATIPTAFVLATFTDLSLATNAANFGASIDYGDGTGSAGGLVLPVNGTPGEFEVVGNHTYDTAGTFTASITVNTLTGALAPIPTTVTVNSPIQLTPNPVNGQVGVRSNTYVASFSDQDTTASVSDFTATINWGDGSSPSSANVLDGSGQGTEFSIFAGHTYTAGGTFTATITLIDTRNGFTSINPITVTVATVPAQTVFNELGPAALTPGSVPLDITGGPDGALWFTESNTGEIGRIDTSGNVTEYVPPESLGTTGNSSITGPDDITTGPDGNLWFTEPGLNEIGQITTQGVFTFFSEGITAGSAPTGITNGPGASLWFTEQSADQIGRITAATGAVTEFSLGSLPVTFQPDSIAEGSDGNLWFVGLGLNTIGRITPSGVVSFFTGATGSDLSSITPGPDGDLWFTEQGSNLIGKINPTTLQVTEYSGPSIVTPTSIVTGPDGDLYYTGDNGFGQSLVGQITTGGVSTDFRTGLTLGSSLEGITPGPDGNMYFAESISDRIGQLVLPQSSVNAISFVPISLIQGQTVSGILGTFAENSTIPTSSNFLTTIDWGDGTPDQVQAPGGGSGHFNTSGAHTYNNPGTFHGTYTISNAAGSQTVDFTANVEAAITVTSNDFTTQADRSNLQFVASFVDRTSSDPSNSHDYVFSIQWGDGTFTNGSIATFGSGDIDAQHDYSAVGTYTVTTTVQLVGGPAYIGISEGTATVTPFVSVLSASGTNVFQTQGSAFNGQVATFKDSSTSTVLPDPSTIYSAVINWGDGTPQTAGQVEGLSTGYVVVGAHPYASLGQFPVTVLISKTNQPDTATPTSTALVQVAGPIDEVKTGITGSPLDITQGPDGALWFTEPGLNAIGRISTGGAVTEFTAGLSSGSQPTGIVTGPDGNLWFTQPFTNSIGRITPGGVVTEFSVLPFTTPGGGSIGDIGFNPLGITLGPDGNLWFTESGGPDGTGMIGRITPSGVVTTFEQGLSSGSIPTAITLGPDGNLWFTDQNGFSPTANAIGRITPQGVITEFNVPTSSQVLSSITTGPDGALWFTEDDPGAIGRITTQGVVTQSAAGLFSDSEPNGINPAPDGNLWFVDTATNHVDRLTTGDVIIPFAIPTSNSMPSKLVAGPDDNLWFTETGSNQIGQVVLPQSVASTNINQSAVSGIPTTVPAATYYYDNSSLVDLTRFFSPGINYGDGTTGSGTLTLASPLEAGGTRLYTLTSSHTYETPGTYDADSALTNAIGTTAPAQFTVDVSSPSSLSFVVTNTNDSGPGSLRQAIGDANEVFGHTITFAIPVQGIVTINVLSELPLLFYTSSIDGSSQAAFEQENIQTPLVEIDGQAVGGVYPGLAFTAQSTGSSVSDLSIFGFGGAQIELDSASDVVWGNYIGLRADGTIPAPLSGVSAFAATGTTPLPNYSSNGILVQAPDAIIGGLGPDQRNVISGNAGQGIELQGVDATSVGIFGNIIGLDPTGSMARGNGINGIASVDGAGHDFIGPGNVISGNAGDGIALLSSESDLISGNAIGTDITVSRAIGNGNDGIEIDYDSVSNTVGGSGLGATNFISGNRSVGVAVQTGSTDTLIEADLIGTNLAGNAAIGNGIAGVLLSDAPNNTVGPENLISGNGSIDEGAGVWIDGPDATGNSVFGNRIGTDLFGEAAIPNSIIGVLINDAPDNIIGGSFLGATNVISGNSVIGVMIAGSGATANLVAGNLIGTDVGGTKAIGNGSTTSGAGIYVDDAPGNFFGGTNAGMGNVISGNPFDGVQVFDTGAVGNLFQFNKVGTDFTGTLPLGNGGQGLLINGAPGTRLVSNIIDSNRQNGIFVSGSTSTSTLIQANLIGRGVSGQVLGNALFGVLIANDAPAPAGTGNINANNKLGPVRDTSLASSTPTSTSSKTTKSKVQVKAASFGDRPLKTLQSRGLVKSKTKPKG